MISGGEIAWPDFPIDTAKAESNSTCPVCCQLGLEDPDGMSSMENEEIEFEDMPHANRLQECASYPFNTVHLGHKFESGGEE